MKRINYKKRFRENILTCLVNPGFLQKLHEALPECEFSIIGINDKKDYAIRYVLTSNGIRSIEVIYNKRSFRVICAGYEYMWAESDSKEAYSGTFDEMISVIKEE